ncbi:Serpentine Receptor, class U [Caenorhabditis elegans]|uniref:Serpentine Receptor, class U n=1 Tax=Caenorhabditis elegans TaxID=6239 RepID=O18020_CAEEL|nr:Serpentine Receptor, class U [Caenorhabditis elegans]CAB05612.2 Serpentine Receptor, class U [Caenorhabditis elegans]|eukprot:NP_502393.2 Serpentine Receptor, class U [Caenorhabditis elegans]
MNESNESNPGIIINLNSNYSNFQFDIFTIPVLLAIVPFIYIIPTCFVIFRIIQVYIVKGLRNNDEMVNKSVFLVIILSQLSCLCFFLSDFLIIRLPSTGILTTWCQQQPENHFLAMLFTTQIYFSYALMIYPVLLTIVRITPIQLPHRHREINSKILAYGIPFVHIYPLFFIFFMVPALGVCRQFKKPYPFGSAFIHFYGSWHDFKNAPFEMINTVFWLITYLLCNFKLHQKLHYLKVNSQCHQNQSARYRRAEISLTLTSVSMILTYIVNLAFQGTFLIDYNLMTYSSFFRPYGNDLETCVVPWVFYLTHPAFQKRQGSIMSSSHQRATRT